MLIMGMFALFTQLQLFVLSAVDYGGGGKGIIDSQTDVGGWPELKSETPPIDTDHDGIPDAWELQHKLNPNDPSDGATTPDTSGYTALELYLNSLVESNSN